MVQDVAGFHATILQLSFVVYLCFFFGFGNTKYKFTFLCMFVFTVLFSTHFATLFACASVKVIFCLTAFQYSLLMSGIECNSYNSWCGGNYVFPSSLLLFFFFCKGGWWHVYLHAVYSPHECPLSMDKAEKLFLQLWIRICDIWLVWISNLLSRGHSQLFLGP